MELTQSEATAFIAMDKIPANDKLIELPDFGGSISVLLKSQNGPEDFILDYRRNQIKFSKRTHQLRARKNIGLVRLDLNGPPHRNPDKQKIGSSHLHLYREGWGLKWAKQIPKKDFPHLDNTYKTLKDFLKYCHIIKEPNFNWGLFS